MNTVQIRRMRVSLSSPTSYAKDGVPGRGESVREPIPNDERGIRFEIQKMREYVRHFSGDPVVVKLARRITELCPSKDRLCEMEAIFQWVKNHMRYVSDPENKELLSTPVLHISDIMTPPAVIKEILGENLINQMMGFGAGHSLIGDDRRKKILMCQGCFLHDRLSGPYHRTSGDCDEGAVFLASLLAAVGIVPRFRFGGQESSSASDGCAYHHVWVQAQDDTGNWVDMDVTEEQSKLGWYFDGFGCTGIASIPF